MGEHQWLIEIAKLLGWEWLLGLAAIVYLINLTGIIPRIFTDRSDLRQMENEALLKGREQMFAELRKTIDFKDEDLKGCKEEISRLKKQLDTAFETIASEQRSNSRLRHSLRNVYQYVAGLRDYMERRGVAPLAYHGWRDLFELDDDITPERVAKVFGEEQNLTDEERRKSDNDRFE